MLRGFERGALDGVGVHGGERGVVDLAGADADHALNRLDEDLPVTDFAGAGEAKMALNGIVHQMHEFDIILRCRAHSILYGVTAATRVTQSGWSTQSGRASRFGGLAQHPPMRDRRVFNSGAGHHLSLSTRTIG